MKNVHDILAELSNFENTITDIEYAISNAADAARDAERAADEAMSEKNYLEDLVNDLKDALYQVQKSDKNEYLEAAGWIEPIARSQRGFTFDVHRGVLLNQSNTPARYAVAYADTEIALDLKHLASDEAERIIAVMLECQAMRADYVGGWYDKERKLYYIEAATLMDELDDVHQHMMTQGQLSAFDFEILDEVSITTLNTLNRLALNDTLNLSALYLRLNKHKSSEQ